MRYLLWLCAGFLSLCYDPVPDVFPQFQYLTQPDLLVCLQGLLYSQVFTCPLDYRTHVLRMT